MEQKYAEMSKKYQKALTNKINSVNIIKKYEKIFFVFELILPLGNKEETMNLKFNLKLVALLIAVLMLMTSCEFSIDAIMGLIPGLGTTTTTTTTTTTKPTTTTTTGNSATAQPAFDRDANSTSQKELLSRYDLTQEYIDETLALLDRMLELSKTATIVDEVDALYDEFEVRFYHIAQQNTIASLIYYCNMSKQESIDRHLAATDMFYAVQDKYTETCRSMYLESPFADVLFADWSEEEIQDLLDYDPTTVELKKEIEELQTQYNNLPSDSNYDESAIAIYVQIVTKNNQLAKLYGYDNYYDYASENVYGRDYKAEDLATFKDYIVKYVVPNFDTLNDGWQVFRDFSTSRKQLFIDFLTGPFDNMKKNYLVDYLNSLEGTMGEGMRDVFESKHCIFANNSNSHPTAFQTYLYEDETPFCLFGSNGQSSNTIIHELGHYYAAYANHDLDNYDLCETHSQSNEYLFIKFCESKMNGSVYSAIRAYNLFNSYYTIIMATMMDEFERTVYSLESVEGMTAADFDAIMTEVVESFGLEPDWVAENLSDPYDYYKMVVIDNPVYYISYAISSIAAVQIFAIAEEDYAAALTAYTTLVEGVTAEDGFLAALTKAGLATPFEEAAFVKVSATMSKK